MTPDHKRLAIEALENAKQLIPEWRRPLVPGVCEAIDQALDALHKPEYIVDGKPSPVQCDDKKDCCNAIGGWTEHYPSSTCPCPLHPRKPEPDTSEYLRGARDLAERLKEEAYAFDEFGTLAVTRDDIDSALAEMEVPDA